MKTLIFVIVFALSSFSASANLCKRSNILKRHRDEASLLRNENFSIGHFAGDETYDAHVIACNRKRDDKKKAIEKTAADHQFLSTLAPRFVKGHIKYLNFAKMKYGYKVQRSRGVWMVTVAAQFHFPKHKFPKKLDIPMTLARELGIGTTICARTTRRFGSISRGYVNLGNSSRLLNACRVKRKEKFNGIVITTHLMKYWKRNIEQYWSHDGIKVRFRIVNLNELSSNELKKYKRRKIIWHIRMNHNKTSRAMYRASIGKPHPLYAGLNHFIIRHEFGHIVGLDDEYPEGNNPPSWRKCSENGGADYIMCNSWGNNKDHVKGTYPWIVTRRYYTGKTL
ncbi:MAG: hypothetical protein ISR65_15110 [Bacteriovoracaceae bacterium]|nr:hypothetical protein [Bacteriovoracaceae bacterium]